MKWLVLTLGVLCLVGCASGKRWVGKTLARSDEGGDLRLYDPHQTSRRSGAQRRAEASMRESPRTTSGAARGTVDVPPRQAGDDGSRPRLSLTGSPRRSPRVSLPSEGRLLGVFRNTYYDFPAEFNYAGQSGGRSIIHDRNCGAIAEVPSGFYGALCVQGSGTLGTGETVSFSRRDCSCAEVCPRTGQRICFDRLDQSEFPWGRGALGTAIIPLSTIAVDSKVIPLGTVVYIPEYDGVERHPGGNPHDGCFVAQDRGMKVVGKHVDVFTGNPSVTEHWNTLVPSNQGVHVYTQTGRCSDAPADPPAASR